MQRYNIFSLKTIVVPESRASLSRIHVAFLLINHVFLDANALPLIAQGNALVLNGKMLRAKKALTGFSFGVCLPWDSNPGRVPMQSATGRLAECVPSVPGRSVGTMVVRHAVLGIGRTVTCYAGVSW